MPPIHPRCRCAIMYREVKGEENKKPAQSKPKQAPASPTTQNPITIKELGARHYGVIQVILANAPNPKAAQVWSKFEGEIKIAATDYKGTAIHKGGLLYLDVAEVAAGDAINKPYQILFHESVHGIDYHNRENGKYFSEWYKEGAFLKAIKADFEELISATKSKLKTKSEEEAYANLQHEWKKYSRITRALLSDLLSAQTNNKYNLGIGHNAKYWQDGGETIKYHEGLSDFAEAALVNK